MTVKRLPNILTLLCMLGAAALIGLDVNRAAFWLMYALCGLSDMPEGLLARRLHAESALGERLDSAADGLFVIACAVRLLPLCDFPLWLWGWIGALAVVRMLAMRECARTAAHAAQPTVRADYAARYAADRPRLPGGGSGVPAGLGCGRAGCALHEKAMKRLDKSRGFSLK